MRYCTVLFNGGATWENPAQLCGDAGAEFDAFEKIRERTDRLNSLFPSLVGRYVTLPESVYLHLVALEGVE